MCQSLVAQGEGNAALGCPPAISMVPNTLGRVTDLACLPGQERAHSTELDSVGRGAGRTFPKTTEEFTR